MTSIDEALAFARENPRAVMVTHRSGDGVQLSPVLVAVDDEGRILVSTRETAVKAKNLERDPRASLCVISEQFFGPWVRLDGTAEVVRLPEALDLLVDYYRRVQGEHDDWDEYRSAMEAERRVVVRITVEAAGPDRSG